MSSKSEITVLLERWNDGEREALTELMPLIVEDLRRIAGKYLADESPGHTLQPTALVNEVYMDLASRRQVSWSNRAQFFAFVAGMMRRVLVDHARYHRRAKRGGGSVQVPLDESVHPAAREKDPDLLALDDALTSLAEVDERQSRIVEMRYFAGLGIDEIAEAENVSPTTVKREWRTAKLWLLRELTQA